MVGETLASGGKEIKGENEMKIQLVKTPIGLKPVSDEDIQKLKKIELGEVIEVDVKVPRNYILHKRLFALLDLMYENDHLELTKERYRKEMLKVAGYYESYIGADGQEVREAKSISFAKMEQFEFDNMYQDMLQVASLRLGLDSGEITEELKYRLGKFF